MPERPSWGVQQAARECGVSVATIRRRIKDGSFPNAEQGAGGAWLIPVTDLIAAGLNPGQPSPPDHSQGVVTEHSHAENAHSHDYAQRASSQVDRVTQLEQELQSARAKNEDLRNQVSLLSANVHDLRTAMRMLEPAAQDRTSTDAPEPEGTTTEQPAPEPPQQSAARPSFLSRLLGRSGS